MKSGFQILAASTLLMATAVTSADVLLMDVIAQQPPNNSSGLLRPSNGMTMDQARKVAGSDYTEKGPVGDPPITSWTYPAYTVYFEHDRVITTVIHR